ncbi:toll/interleukin-1 receptor domain-containing protein [Lysobacter hankyongensis]|uniref:TIR domain-containing protein n=1 Tax=Lysobacter hankyongensis TaxID=1176535 RepID=A0ABP9B9F7_9GAMM
MLSRKMLFISHSSADSEIVEALINFLEKSFKGENRPDIRCTSVEGYKLSLGDTPKAKLPSEINSSLVICLLTPRSLQSPWVLFELGAAWGLSSRVVPLLYEVKHDQLPAALSGDIAGYLGSRGDILSLVDQISSATGWEKEAASRIDSALNVFMRVVDGADSTPAERLFQRRQLQKELPFDEIYRRVKKEIFVWGWSGVNANNQRTRNMISQLTSSGKKVNFLVLSPSKAKAASKHLALGPVCSWTEDGVGTDIAAGMRFLVELRESLPSSGRFNFECRETSWLMTWSGIAIDPKDNYGLLQIESYLYCFADHVGTSNHLDYRPNLLLTRSSLHYEPFWYSLERMWSEASPFHANEA